MNGIKNEPFSKKSRLLYLDHIKVFLILLVVAHHAGQAYGPIDDWPLASSEKSAILGPFFDVNGAFFMGLFFLISAYFIPASIDKRGVYSFIKSRFIRLGIPFIVVVIVLFGPITYFVDGVSGSFWEYMIFDYIGTLDFEIGHLWFIALLFFLSVCYALVRVIMKIPNPTKSRSLGHKQLFLFSLSLIIANMLIRIWFPVGEWVNISPFMPVEVGRLPQYISFFAFGILAYRSNWLENIPIKTGVIWFIIGIIAAAMHYLNVLTGLRSVYIWLVLEGFIGVGLIIGILVIGREFANNRGKLLAFMAENAFAVYIIHIFVVYILQGAMEEIPSGALTKFFIVSILASLLSFLFSHLIRKIPTMKKVL
ncbi:acyltransferase family protein [Shouchella rhizosphaerae]|uniref:acyltransferase family protein n=1 Tax=Shouchella rhizosphaerae TaxID=866786 RepID=UPI00203D786E|nr:acyltransferase family protein [Shouchella rhizosphaerae]MCM3380669.1 acyltransferase family protein [Shouchella rhizosphaerae]